jgi:type I restriction enzyme S subunit
MSSKQAAVGAVPANWHVGELREFLSLITYGFTNPMPDSGEGPWKLTAKDVVGGRINYATARRTTVDAFERLLTDKSRPTIGDVLLTKDGSIGRVAVVDRGGVCINQSVALLRPNQRISPEFLKYLLLSPHYQAVMEGDSDGSTIKHIYITRVDKMQVAVPPLSEQKAIVATIGSLDDRIVLLRETNATLEAIAQALFKSWFVDFDPVRAKLDGRAPEGMDEATAALFPDSFEDSELGEVPKGWQAGTVDSLASLNPESWSTKQHPERIRYVDLANTKANEIDGVAEFSFDEAPSRARRILRLGDVIVGTVRPGNRSFARIARDISGLTGSTGFAVLRARHEFDQALVYIATTRDEAIDRLAHLADGGAYPAVRPDVVGNTPLVISPQEVRIAFGEVANDLFASIGSNQERARVLAELRDTLLPRLISGQLRLPEANELIEPVLA